MVTAISPSLLQEIIRQRWFASKGRAVRGALLLDQAVLGEPRPSCRLELLEVQFAEGPAETYTLVRDDERLDVLDDRGVAHTLLRQFRLGATLAGQRGTFVFSKTHLLDDTPENATVHARLLGAEQSNTSVRYGDVLVLKVIRRLQPGVNPDLEIPWFLTERTTFRNAALQAGALEYVTPDGTRAAVGSLQAFVPNRGDAWQTTLRRVGAVLDGAEQASAVEPLRRLGAVTAGLHVALSSVDDDADFAPQPIRADDLSVWIAAIEAEVDQVLSTLPAGVRPSGAAVLRARARGLAALDGCLKIRHHGDYHLGQVLERSDGETVDFAIIDFEGEPAKPLALRRERRSALRDVAGLLRSLDYARPAVLRAGDATDPARQQRANGWHDAAREAFLGAYFRTVRAERPALLPADQGATQRALSALELEKAAYEVLYEWNNRPDWLPIPLAAFRGS